MTPKQVRLGKNALAAVLSSRPRGARAAALLAGICLAAGAAQGQDASWIGSGGVFADWNTAANWSPATVPAGTATFTSSGTTTTQIRTSASTVVNALQFDAGAPAYRFDFSQPLTVAGAGFTGNSGVATMTAGSLNFLNSSSAGSANDPQGHRGIPQHQHGRQCTLCSDSRRLPHRRRLCELFRCEHGSECDLWLRVFTPHCLPRRDRDFFQHELGRQRNDRSGEPHIPRHQHGGQRNHHVDVSE